MWRCEWVSLDTPNWMYTSVQTTLELHQPTWGNYLTQYPPQLQRRPSQHWSGPPQILEERRGCHWYQAPLLPAKYTISAIIRRVPESKLQFINYTTDRNLKTVEKCSRFAWVKIPLDYNQVIIRALKCKQKRWEKEREKTSVGNLFKTACKLKQAVYSWSKSYDQG